MSGKGAWDWKEHSSDFDSTDSSDTEEWQSWLARQGDHKCEYTSVHPSTVLHLLMFSVSRSWHTRTILIGGDVGSIHSV